jgi:site-specific recombinase XerD
MRTAGEMEFPVDEQHFLRMRNQALLATLIGTGARRSEVAALTVGDVSLRADNSGDLHIRSAKKVRGRTVHQRMVCFDRYTGRYLAPWLALRRRDADAPLWPSVVNGNSLTGQGVYKVLRTIVAAAKVEIGGAHDLRRTFITYFADKRPGEGYYHLLQLQIGHKPQGITHQLYDLRTIESIRAVFCSPMEEVVRLIRV